MIKSIHSLESIVGSPTVLSPIKLGWHMRTEINGKQIRVLEINHQSKGSLLSFIGKRRGDIVEPSKIGDDATLLTHGFRDMAAMSLRKSKQSPRLILTTC